MNKYLISDENNCFDSICNLAFKDGVHIEELKNSTPHVYSGPHAYCFLLKCPSHIVIRDHTLIRATRVLRYSYCFETLKKEKYCVANQKLQKNANSCTNYVGLLALRI